MGRTWTLSVGSDSVSATVRGAGAVVGESVAVRCVNAAGTGFESCAGSGGGGAVDANVTNASLAVTGTFWQATQPVSGPLTDAQLRAVAVPVSGTFWQSTQPVSGTVTANAGSGTFTVGDGSGPLTVDGSVSATISGSISNTAFGITQTGTSNDVDATITNSSLAVTGPLTDAQLRASAVPISGTVTANQGGTWTARINDGAGASIGSGGTGTGLTVTCTNCGGSVAGSTYIASALGVASGAAKDYISLYNASGSGKVIRIVRIIGVVDSSAAVTGLQPGFTVSRYTTDGATCTAVTVQLLDTANAAVPAQVTAKTNCTTDPTALTNLFRASLYADETQPGTQVLYEYPDNGGQPITLREGQGLTLISGASAPAGTLSISIEFTM